MTTTSGGNLSIRDQEGNIWITPSRVDKGNLTPDDMVCVKPDGETIGRYPYSSEFPFHRKIYEVRPDIKAVVHAHPVALVAFSMCGQTPDCRVFPKAFWICGKIGFAPYRLPGSEALGDIIAEQFAAGSDCVLLENHGVVVGGETLEHAFRRFETLEFAARSIIQSKGLGETLLLNDESLALEREFHPELESFEPDAATLKEQELRTELAAFVRRGYAQQLLISTEGSFSARIDDKKFVITRAGADRMNLKESDLCLIDGDSKEEGTRPSRATRLHAAIYERNPDVRVIINATPVNATAFCITQSNLDTRTIPESYIVLRDILRIPFKTLYQEPEKIADAISINRPVALIENDGVLLVGTSVLDGFDRLEVLEATADAFLNTRSLGALSPMSDASIAELKSAFSLKD